MLDMALSCAVSSKPSPAQSRITNVKKYPFILVYWVCCFDRAKKSLFPLQPHRTFRVFHPHPPPAVGGSQGTRLVLPSNSSLGFPAGEEEGLLCSWVLPLSWFHFCCGHSWSWETNRQHGATAKCKIQMCPEAARTTREAAVGEGCALIILSSDEHRGPSVGIPAAHLCPQPPPGCWSSDAHLWAADASLSFGRASAEPSSAGGSVHGTMPTAEGSFPLHGPKHLNLECRLDLAHLNMVVTPGWWDVPQTWLSPCFSLFINHIHYDRNVQTAWIMRCVRQVK